jgi:uncharacterized protein YlxW (UPF0749 family)
MDSDREQPSVRDAEQEMEDEAGRMQHRLDELGEQVEDAQKTARDAREDTGAVGDDALDTVAGDASQRSTSSDDPASAVGDPTEET